MNCPYCNKPMSIELVKTYTTTSPDKDDLYEEMWWCEPCKTAMDVEEEEEDVYDPDKDFC